MSRLKKILKRTAIVLVVILLVYLISASFLPGRIHVERTTAVKADPALIFGQINDLKNWKTWSYWDRIDPAMKSTYSGPASGAGMKHSWESANDSVGKGSLTITKSEPNTFVETELYFDGMGTSLGGWKLQEKQDYVEVSTYMDIDVAFLLRPMMAMMDMDKMLGADFEKTLAGLKKRCESLPPPENQPQMALNH